MIGVKEALLSENNSSRRRLLFPGLQIAASGPSCYSKPAHVRGDRGGHEPFFKTRGAILATPDLSTLGWPQCAANAGLTTIARHVAPSDVSRFIQIDRGREFLAPCRDSNR